MSLSNWDINTGNWSLFLDRDGVINRRRVDDYVKNWEEFIFLPGVLEAIALFSQKFQYIFIVTNQQGIGKGLMTEADLEMVHKKMQAEIEKAGGRIDAIYFCPSLASKNDPLRKPNPGMAYKAQKEFPKVDFKKSLMIGDSVSDMEFAINAGMHRIFIGNLPENVPVDGVSTQLLDVANELD